MGLTGIAADRRDQFLGAGAARIGREIGMRDTFTHVLRDDLVHQTVHGAAGSRNEVQGGRAIVTRGQRPLDRGNLPRDPSDALRKRIIVLGEVSYRIPPYAIRNTISIVVDPQTDYRAAEKNFGSAPEYVGPIYCRRHDQTTAGRLACQNHILTPATKLVVCGFLPSARVKAEVRPVCAR